MTNPACECPLAGYCNRHKINKGERSHQYCKGIGDKAWKYWEAWEQGKLGATAPESPMLDKITFGVNSEDDEPDDLSTIGTELEAIFERVTGTKIECDDCKKAVLRLNLMSAAQVEYERVSIVDDIKGRIPNQAPLMWKALAFVDGVLHLGQTEAKLNDWLSEAIAAGGAIPHPKKKSEGTEN